MGDWPAQQQDWNLITITTASTEACGAELAANATTVATAWTSANRAIYVPFVVFQPFSAQKMLIDNGATINGNLDVGIFDEGANRLVSSGSTAHAGASGIQTLDITDTTLLPGQYYMALASDSTTATFRVFSVSAGRGSGMGVLQQASALALPATATFAAFTDTIVPMISVLGRTLV